MYPGRVGNQIIVIRDRYRVMGNDPCVDPYVPLFIALPGLNEDGSAIS